MDKKWLIRTRSNHILGPVSKEKVIELYKNASIKPDDEICSGNGYWFFIREVELVEKYLIGSTPQSFNPISEAKDVITSSQIKEEEVEDAKDDITMVGGINLGALRQEAVEPSTQSSMELEEVDVPEVPEKGKLLEIADSSKKKTNLGPRPKSSPGPSVKKTPQKSQNYLTYLGMFIFVVLFLVLYFRKTIMKSFFTQTAVEQVISFPFISNALAQDDLSPQKKNS